MCKTINVNWNARNKKNGPRNKAVSSAFRNFTSGSVAVLVNLSFMTRMAVIVWTVVATVIVIVDRGVPTVAVVVLMRVGVLVGVGV